MIINTDSIVLGDTNVCRIFLLQSQCRIEMSEIKLYTFLCNDLQEKFRVAFITKWPLSSQSFVVAEFCLVYKLSHFLYI